MHRRLSKKFAGAKVEARWFRLMILFAEFVWPIEPQTFSSQISPGQIVKILRSASQRIRDQSNESGDENIEENNFFAANY